MTARQAASTRTRNEAQVKRVCPTTPGALSLRD